MTLPVLPFLSILVVFLVDAGISGSVNIDSGRDPLLSALIGKGVFKETERLRAKFNLTGGLFLPWLPLRSLFSKTSALFGEVCLIREKKIPGGKDLNHYGFQAW